MPSARRHLIRTALVVACFLVSVTALAGCVTTQETAALKQAESKRILAARRHRQQVKSHNHKPHDHGSKKR